MVTFSVLPTGKHRERHLKGSTMGLTLQMTPRTVIQIKLNSQSILGMIFSVVIWAMLHTSDSNAANMTNFY